MDLNDSYQAFCKLLETPSIKEFLYDDVCYILADKYILATTFIYFQRAKMHKVQYTERNFYLIIHLIHDLYEEVEECKYDIIQSYLNSRKRPERYAVRNFLQNRFSLLEAMRYDTYITKEACDEVINTFPNLIWKRARRTNHSGVVTGLLKCSKCGY